jgi:hypothetical protein
MYNSPGSIQLTSPVEYVFTFCAVIQLYFITVVQGGNKLASGGGGAIIYIL